MKAVSSRGASRIRADLPVYIQLARVFQQVTYVYRAGLVFNVASILIQVYLLKVVWTAVYAGRSSVGTLGLQTLITTLTLGNLQLWVIAPFIANYLYQRVYEGKIALDLARPVGFLSQMLALQVGYTVGIVPFVLLALPVALLIGGLQPPSSALAAALYLLSLALAYLISVLMGLVLGLSAFWTLEIGGFLGMYRFVSQFFAGALVPLQFFPPALRAVAAVLPFQAQAYLPLALYEGQLQGANAVEVLALQLFWVLALYAITQVVWRRAIRRVVIQGG
jgi:ABC-type uncharacterized transport system permease subunit